MVGLQDPAGGYSGSDPAGRHGQAHQLDHQLMNTRRMVLAILFLGGCVACVAVTLH